MRPQDELPVERAIHYIVKDYRRMYNMHESLLDKLYQQEAELARMRLALSQQKCNGELKQQIHNLQEQNDSLKVKYNTARQKATQAVNKYNKIRARLLKFQNLLSQLPKELEDIENDEVV